MSKFSFLLLAPLLIATLPAYGGNLVVNPGFETGNFTGWNVASALPWQISGVVPHTGTYDAVDGCTGLGCLDPTTGSWIEQTLTTVPSTAYALTFWMNPGAAPNSPVVEIDAFWNGAKVGAFVSEPAGWHQFTVSGLVATSASTVLEFTGRNDPADVYLDDVDVEAPTGGVPEPMSFMLSGLGLAFLGLVRARRVH